MDNPVQVVKTALNPGMILKFVAGAIVAFAIFDLLNITPWLLQPITTAKAKFTPAK